MDIFNQIGNTLQQALRWVVSLLPDSPFKLLDNSPIKQYLAFVNWICPFDFVITTLEAWLVAVAAYYCWSVLLRWVKAIG